MKLWLLDFVDTKTLMTAGNLCHVMGCYQGGESKKISGRHFDVWISACRGSNKKVHKRMVSSRILNLLRENSRDIEDVSGLKAEKMKVMVRRVFTLFGPNSYVLRPANPWDFVKGVHLTAKIHVCTASCSFFAPPVLML